MAFQTFDIGINESNLIDQDILFDVDEDLDDLLLTISPTVLQNQENHIENMTLPEPSTHILHNVNTNDLDPEIPYAELPESDSEISDHESDNLDSDQKSEDEDIPRKRFKEAEDGLRSRVHGNRNKSTIDKTTRETERFKQYLKSEGEIGKYKTFYPRK